MPKVKEYTKSGLVSLGRLKKAIKDGNYVNGFTHLSKKGNIIEVWGDAIADESGMDAEVSSHDGLNDYKAKVLKQIRDKDERVLANSSFTYDGKHFGLSAPHRLLWIGIVEGQDRFPPQAWPMSMTTTEGEQYLLSKVEADNFWVAAMVTIKSILDASASYKQAIFDATTKEEVDAALAGDNR